jgi:hypothetical protein
VRRGCARTTGRTNASARFSWGSERAKSPESLPARACLLQSPVPLAHPPFTLALPDDVTPYLHCCASLLRVILTRINSCVDRFHGARSSTSGLGTTFCQAHSCTRTPSPSPQQTTTSRMSEPAQSQGNVPPSVSTPQQQPLGTPTQQNAPTPASASAAGDSLVCQWQNCGERCPSAEQLYVSRALHQLRQASFHVAYKLLILCCISTRCCMCSRAELAALDSTKPFGLT